MGTPETPEQILLRHGYAPTTDERGQEHFFQHALERHPDAVRAYVELGMPLDQVYCNRTTPLHRAIEQGTSEIVACLLELGADITMRDRVGDTPLHTAAQWGKPDLVDLLLRAGADVAALSDSGTTCLTGAARYKPNERDEETERKRIDMIDLLLRAGADPNQPNRDGTTALWHAACFGQRSMVTRLHSAGASPNVANASGIPLIVFLTMLSTTNWADISNLLKIGAALNATNRHGWSARMVAEWRDLHDIASALGQHGAALPSDKRAAMLKAASQGDLASVQKYLGQRAPVPVDTPCWDGTTALGLACTGGHIDVVRALLSAGADTEATADGGLHPLSMVAGNSTAIMRLLLDAGADVNGGSGAALRFACRAGQIEQVQMLLDAGADVQLVNKLGYDCLMFAREHPAIVALLLRAGADVRRITTDSMATTALQRAAYKGYHETMRLLIDAGADLNVREGVLCNTALYSACDEGRIETARILLEAGADPLIESYSGTSVLQHVRIFQKAEAEALLIDHMVDAPYRAALARVAVRLAPADLRELGHTDAGSAVDALQRAFAPPDPAAQIPGEAGPEPPLANPPELLAMCAQRRTPSAAPPEGGALLAAVRAGDAPMVRALVAQGAPIGGEALREAAERGHDQIATALLQGMLIDCAPQAEIDLRDEQMLPYSQPLRRATLQNSDGEPAQLDEIRLGIRAEWCEIEDLAEIMRAALAGGGWHIFRAEVPAGAGHSCITALHSPDGLLLPRFYGTCSPYYNHSNNDILQRLHEWDVRYGIDILGAGRDWVQVAFHTDPETRAFDMEIYKLCPELVEESARYIGGKQIRLRWFAA